MSRSPAARTMAVIIAAIDARATIRAGLSRWLEELDGDGELIVVDASRDGTADVLASGFPRVRVLRRPHGRLAPELWRDGLEVSVAPYVAFSTAQMVPAPGWRRAMLDRLDDTGAAVVGGPIEPAPGLSPLDRAVYLLRYVHYLRPLITSAHIEPPGDNAVYCRDRLSGLESLWGEGFWEVEIHRALRERGEISTMAEDAVVAFQGGTRLGSLLPQRYAHARHYGASRAGRIGTVGRLAHVVAAPAVPLVMLHRIAAALASRGRSLGPWMSAMPGLLALLGAWSLGEARGMGAGLPRGRHVVQADRGVPTHSLR